MEEHCRNERYPAVRYLVNIWSYRWLLDLLDDKDLKNEILSNIS